VTVDISRSENLFQISITDDGPGIPDTEIKPILTGEETELEHASSLGLWLVYWGTQSLNGDLDITSSDDGTTATVRIPDIGSTETTPSRHHDGREPPNERA
jgi:sensor histidine kinase regulating citrate/malate metabolism